MTDPTPRRGRGFSPNRSVLVRDFLIFVLKLTVDGLKDVVLLPVASVAFVADLLIGSSRNPRLFYRAVRVAERFDRWLNLTGALDELERGETEDGLFGASTAGSDTLLGKVEELVRGRDAVERDGGRRGNSTNAPTAGPDASDRTARGESSEGSSDEPPRGAAESPPE